LAERKLYTLLVCDEAHTIPLHGHSFHQEFVQIRKGVLKAMFLSNPSICVLAMSASFQFNEQSKFASIMLVKPTNIIWGPVARRGILFHVSILGNLSLSLSLSLNV
jgi:superfamily II DNA helicase RecQ